MAKFELDNSIALRNKLQRQQKKYIRKERECKAKGVPSGSTSLYTITFNTENEKLNFTNFIYSNLGFKFLSKLFTSINADSYVIVRKYYPKVDWTRSWTVEEILKDYGYTEDEIKKIIPHRYPFLLVDCIEELEPGVKAVGYKNVTVNVEPVE